MTRNDPPIPRMSKTLMPLTSLSTWSDLVPARRSRSATHPVVTADASLARERRQIELRIVPPCGGQSC